MEEFKKYRQKHSLLFCGICGGGEGKLRLTYLKLGRPKRNIDDFIYVCCDCGLEVKRFIKKLAKQIDWTDNFGWYTFLGEVKEYLLSDFSVPLNRKKTVVKDAFDFYSKGYLKG